MLVFTLKYAKQLHRICESYIDAPFSCLRVSASTRAKLVVEVALQSCTWPAPRLSRGHYRYGPAGRAAKCHSCCVREAAAPQIGIRLETQLSVRFCWFRCKAGVALDVNAHRSLRTQILSVSEDGTSFELHEKALDAVLRQVPDGMMISVVSVVGAFRTGKSFLLDLFLRYLRWCAEHATDGDNGTS